MSQGNDRTATPTHDVGRSDPAYWILDEEEDFYEHVCGSTSSFTHLRQNIRVKHYFPHICGLYRFNETMLATVSVIMTLRKEVPGMVTLSAQSILAGRGRNSW